MKYSTCDECKKEKQLNELIIYNENKYCNECILKKEEYFNTINDNIIRLIDDTVCSNCNLDNGDNELKKIDKFPLCEKCYNFIQNRPFPLWIKLSMILLFLIILSGLFYNSKYIFSYLEIIESKKLYQMGKLKEACIKMNSASQKLPHLEYLKSISNLYYGIYFLSNDDSQKALALFESYKKYFPDDKNINKLILEAKAGISYNSKDYQSFYEIQKELYKLNPDDAISIAGISSAASCLYIITNKKKYKDEMNEYFKIAQIKMQPEEKNILNEYIQRIKYRIYSKKIISAKEYYKEFPEGWKGDIE